MDSGRWAQIEELFHRVAECDPNRRSALLDEACNGDSELRREVEALLSFEASAHDHVQAAIRTEIADFNFSLQAGEMVSHYRILGGLGGGGMGLVYQAEDVKLGRRVATGSGGGEVPAPPPQPVHTARNTGTHLETILLVRPAA